MVRLALSQRAPGEGPDPEERWDREANAQASLPARQTHPGAAFGSPSFVGPLNQSPNQGSNPVGALALHTRVGPCRRDRAQTPTSIFGSLKFGPWFHGG